MTPPLILNGMTLALVIVAAFALRELRGGAWWQVPRLVGGSAVVLGLLAFFLWAAAMN
jgi:hypothetical protein